MLYRIAILSVILVGLSLPGAAMGANSVVIHDQLAVPVGATVDVPVLLENNGSIRTIVIPLVIRQVSGTGSLASVQLLHRDRLMLPGGPLSDIVFQNVFLPPAESPTPGLCNDEFSRAPAFTDTMPHPLPMLPAGVLFVRSRIFSPDLPAGTDGSGSFLLRMQLSENAGCLLIDTTCIDPHNTLLFVDASGPQDVIYPAFDAASICSGPDQVERLPVAIDIKPGSCPNPLNLTPSRFEKGQSSKGKISVAILGSEDFDVTTVDPASVRLAGASPIRHSYSDVGTDFMGGDDCECNDDGRDGFMDLVFKFMQSDIAAALSNPVDGESYALELTGELDDSSLFIGTDCVLVRERVAASRIVGAESDGPLETSLTSFPNPFNASTVIVYTIPEDGRVEIGIFNVLGQQVATLVDSYQPAGRHEVTWDGRDAHGNDLASGMYLYRCQTENQVVTRKMVMLK